MVKHSKLSALLSCGDFGVSENGIYYAKNSGPVLSVEPGLNIHKYSGPSRGERYLVDISRNHSIPVMDYEIDRFLRSMPKMALILDIGGCWGWHWRRIGKIRPDIGVLIVDFAPANLINARNILGSLVGNQVSLMHADATSLPFQDADKSPFPFDGVWTVQVFQHIHDFSMACSEAWRVLRSGGKFMNYSLHATPMNRVIYRILGQKYHMDGMKTERFFLSRASDGQRRIVEKTFGNKVADRFTECLFHPDLNLTFSGGVNNMIGSLDARLGNCPWLARWIARQRAFEVSK